MQMSFNGHMVQENMFSEYSVFLKIPTLYDKYMTSKIIYNTSLTFFFYYRKGLLMNDLVLPNLLNVVDL